ncbi:hypothetical protein ACFL6I_26655, partial [candidate division KSB1 bacterium]
DLIQELRSNYFWHGRALAIFPTVNNVNFINHLCFFCHTNNQYSFSNIRGHRAISEPILLTTLLNEVTNKEKITPEQWLNIKNESPLYHVKSTLPKAQKYVKTGDISQAATVIEECVEVIKNVKSAIILNHDAARVFEQIEKLSMQNLQNAQEIMDNIEILLNIKNI